MKLFCLLINVSLFLMEANTEIPTLNCYERVLCPQLCDRYPNECGDVDSFFMSCGFDLKNKIYKMFADKCIMHYVMNCTKTAYIETPLIYCVKYDKMLNNTRRAYGEESCPVFCPDYYRPVCGASKIRDYNYKAFKNGCYLDMINCRGEYESDGYVEVPLQFCPKHSMKNIWTEQIVFST